MRPPDEEQGPGANRSPEASPTTTTQQGYTRPTTRYCASGRHLKGADHVEIVRLELATTRDEWDDAVKAGYVRWDSRWDGRDRRRT